MVITSGEIAQLSGMYQGMAMQQVGFSQMLAMNNPNMSPGMNYGQAYQGARADNMMGWGLNKAKAIGTPLAGIGAGLLGIDPLSMAMKGGMAGMAMGGIGGGIAGGLAAGGIAFGGVAATGFAIDQMYQGAGQQHQLNSTLRSNFQFMGQHGRGFTRSDMSQIGGDLRTQVGRMGPNGDMVGMEELTQLAGNMGKMGMMKGVTDAQEFTRKFKEQLQALKTISTELGTSLEAAQHTISSMRSSGVFQKNDQIKMAGFMRQGSMVGISSEEISSLANIGSQVTRAIGGRGRNGAMAGAKVALAIGGAADSGILSEEDIYNATGLTGQEGRTALGASQLQLNAAFLKSGLGRRHVASIAGKGGKLDESALSEYLGASGNTKGGTMKNAYEQLGKVGRADFIYNEGKLRGSAMEADPFAAQRQMSSWLEDSGISMEDPRAKIFLKKRFAGMGMSVGNDELEAGLKLAQSLPELDRNMDKKNSTAQEMKKMESFRRNTGIEGLKRKLEDSREHIQNKLQKVGSDFFNEGGEMLDRMINEIAQQYISTYSGDIDKAFTSASKGDRSMFKRTFGERGGTVDKLAGPISDKFGKGMSALEGFNKTGLFGIGESDSERFEKAGYRSKAKGETTAAEYDMFKRINAAAGGVGTAESIKMGRDKKALMLDVMSTGDINGKGVDQLDSFAKALGERNDKESLELQDYLNGSKDPTKGSSSKEARMARYAGLLHGSNLMSDEQRKSLVAPEAFADLDMSKFATLSQREEEFGKLLKRPGQEKDWWRSAENSVDAKLENMIFGEQGKGKASAKSTGKFLASKEGFELSSKLLSGGSDATGAREDVQKRLAELNARERNGKLSDGDKGMQETLQAMDTAGKVALHMSNNPNASKEDAIKAVAKQEQMSVEDVSRHTTAVATAVKVSQNENITAQVKRLNQQGDNVLSDYMKKGLVKDGKIDEEVVGKMSAGTQDILKRKLSMAQGASMANSANGQDSLDSQAAQQEGLDAVFSGGTVQEMKSRAKELRRAGDTGSAHYQESIATNKRKLERGARYGQEGAVANALGIRVDQNLIKQTKGMSDEALASFLAEQQGFNASGEEGKKYSSSLATAISAYKKGGSSKGALALTDVDASGARTEANRDRQAKENPLFADMAKSLDQVASTLKNAFPQAKDGAPAVQQVNVINAAEIRAPKDPTG